MKMSKAERKAYDKARDAQLTREVISQRHKEDAERYYELQQLRRKKGPIK